MIGRFYDIIFLMLLAVNLVDRTVEIFVHILKLNFGTAILHILRPDSLLFGSID